MLLAALLGGPFFYALYGSAMEIIVKTKTSMDERILAIAEPVAADLGFAIVRVRVMGGKRSTLQIMAERTSDGQMSVANCAELSRELSSTFEVEDPIDEGYVLEVSSPGLDRPLTDIAHFDRYKGMLARLELDRLVEGRKRFRGLLAGVDGDNIAIDLEKEDETALIPFAWLAEAKLLITDELIKQGQEQKATTNKENKKGDE